MKSEFKDVFIDVMKCIQSPESQDALKQHGWTEDSFLKECSRIAAEYENSK